MLFTRKSPLQLNYRRTKLIGVFIAFHWAYGWVEDATKFDILNISLWSAISMGLSSQFRAMSDKEFLKWFEGVFKKG